MHSVLPTTAGRCSQCWCHWCERGHYHLLTWTRCTGSARQKKSTNFSTVFSKSFRVREVGGEGGCYLSYKYTLDIFYITSGLYLFYVTYFSSSRSVWGSTSRSSTSAVSKSWNSILLPSQITSPAHPRRCHTQSSSLTSSSMSITFAVSFGCFDAMLDSISCCDNNCL